jgi:predicted MFS family arabinose efflux permease
MLLRITHTYRNSFSDLSKETWLLSLVVLINRAGTMVVPFMSMYVTQRMHGSIADAGLIITLFGAGAVLGSSVSGYFIDRISFRAVQVFTSLMGGILFLLMGQISSFGLLCVMTVVLAFVSEAFRPANAAAISAYSTPQNLTRSYSLNRLAMNLGWALGSSLGGILAAVNYELLFWTEGIVYILVGSLILVILPPVKQAPKAAVRTPLPAAAKQSPWKDPFLLRFLILVAVYCVFLHLLFRLVPVYWKEQLHMHENVIGMLLGLNGIIIALFEMVLVKYWENRRSNIYYIISGVIATALGYVFLVLPGVAPVFMAVGAVLFITLGEMLALPFINTVIMSRASEHNRGQYAGAFALSFSVAQIIGPAGGALITEKFGYAALWWVLVILCLLCALGFKVLNGRK